MHRLAGPMIAALALSLTATAQAADIGGTGDGFDWTGLHLGVVGGYGRVGESGPLLGGVAGYDWRFDDVVVGIEGDLSGGGIDGRRAGGDFDIDLFGTIRARVGYAFDRFVVYGTAGAAFASVDYARGGRSDDATQFGWTAGGGIEAHLYGGLSAKAEYLYVDLDRKTFRPDGRGVGIGAAGSQVRLGLNYRF